MSIKKEQIHDILALVTMASIKVGKWGHEDEVDTDIIKLDALDYLEGIADKLGQLYTQAKE